MTYSTAIIYTKMAASRMVACCTDTQGVQLYRKWQGMDMLQCKI